MRRVISLLVLALFVAACGDAKLTSTLRSPSPSTSALATGEAMERPNGGLSQSGEEEEDVKQTEEEEAAEIEDYYVEVFASGARFRPSSFEMALTQQVELKNRDSVKHNITIPAAGISTDVTPGTDSYTRAISMSPGRYEFYCRFHKSSGMRGTFLMTNLRYVIVLRRGY